MIILVIAIPFPQPAETGLDGSWRIGISLLDPKQYPTTPIVFTYGFLGYLVRGAALPAALGPIIGFRLAVYAVYSYLAIYYITRLQDRTIRLAGVLAFALPSLLSLVKPYYQTEFQLALLPLLVLFLPSKTISSQARIIAISIFSGLVFHTKTSLFYYFIIPALVSAFCTGVTSNTSSAGRRIGASIALPLIAAITSLLTITTINQLATGTILPEFMLIKEISSGYSAGMSVSGSALEVVVAITSLCFMGILALHLYLGSDRRGRVFLFRSLPPLFFVLALSFKHGFVRQGHSPRFFVIQIVAFIIFVIAACQSEKRITHRLKDGMALVFITYSLLAGYLVSLASVAKSADFTGKVKQHLAYLTDPFNFARIIDSKSRQNMQAALLPEKIRDRVGTDSIDIVPREISVAYANRLNWFPRPTLQSYQGYTSVLDRLNALHIANKGPDYILLHQDSLDEKSQQFYSPQEHIAIICKYNPVADGHSVLLGAYVLLKRAGSDRCLKPTTEPAIFKTLFSRKTIIPYHHGASIAVLSLDIRPNAAGKIMEALFRGPELYIHLEHHDKSTETYRFSYTNSRDGLVVLPLQKPTSRINCLFPGSSSTCSTTQPSAFRVTSSSSWLFQPSIQVQVRHISFRDFQK